ncbi:MAG: protein kinase [Planctomycetota bacterium]
MTEKELFLAAMDIEDPVERQRYLNAACADHPELRFLVESLLKTLVGAGDFLQTPAIIVDEIIEIDLANRAVEEPETVESGTQLGSMADTAPTMIGGRAAPGGEQTGAPLGGARTEFVSLGKASQPEIDAFPAGTKFGRYVIEKTLGHGGMGVVYLARDTRLSRRVALKIPRFDACAELQLVERFHREARTMASVLHRNLCPVFDVDEIDGCHILAMAFIDGEPLSKVLSRGLRLAPVQIADWVQKLALALGKAHQAGVIHRDIKPANIMIDHEGEPILMDFGLARSINEMDTHMTQTGLIVGTPAYMAPEQATGDADAVGPWSDQYSLGVIFYELLTGKTLHTGNLTRILASLISAKPPVKPTDIRRDIDPELERICLKALAHEPHDRFSRIHDLADALGRYLAQSQRPRAERALPQDGLVSGSTTLDETTVYRSHSDLLKRTSENTRQKPRGRRGLTTLAALVLVLAAVFVIQTSNGVYELTTDDPTIAALLGDSGGIVVEDRQTGQPYTLKHGANRQLPVGDYNLTVTTPEGLELDTPKFTIKRWGKVVASVRMRAVAPPPAVDPSQTPATVSKLEPGSDAMIAFLKLTPTERLTSPDYEWSPLEDLGEPINTPGYEAGAFAAKDGLSLLFHGNEDRIQRTGKLRLWQAWRHSTNEPFGKPVLLDTIVNDQPDNLSDPTLSADGLILAFCMRREDGQGGFDLWFCTRPGGDASWSAPLNAGSEVNSVRSEWEPELSADGLTLVFHSDRSTEHGGTDLWITRRDSRDNPFGPAENLGANINTVDHEGGVTLSSDGLTLLFHRISADTSTRVTHWQATRPTARDPFGQPQPLVIPGLTVGRCVSLSLSPTADRLYVTTASPDNGPNIAVSRRVPKTDAKRQ